MPVTIVNNATMIWDCESTSGAVGNKPALETEILKENLNSVDFTTTQTTTESSFDGTIPDLSGQHIRIWYTSITFPNMATKANGGVCFYADDGTNRAFWSLGGKDTYSGGWINGLVYIDSTPDSGSVDSSAITEMGIIHMNGYADDSYATRPKNQINTWVDYLRYGDGLLAYGSPTFGIDILAEVDQSAGAGYGVIETSNETHFIYGSIEYGRTSEQTIYSDENELMIFADANVSTTLYGIRFIGDTSITSTFSIKSSVLTSAGARFYLDLDDSNIASLDFIGNTIYHTNEIHFLGSSLIGIVTNNSFGDCDTIYPQGCTFSNNTMSNTFSIVGSLYLTDITTIDVCSNLIFNEYAGTYAIYIPASITGTITLNNFVGDGSGTDVYWAGVAGTLTINKSNGTNFTTWGSGGGTVELVSSVSISVNVKDSSGADVVGALVYIDEDLEVAGEIVNTTTDGNGDVATSYSGGATSATVRVRKYGYKANVGSISLSSDSNTNVVLITDPQQN